MPRVCGGPLVGGAKSFSAILIFGVYGGETLSDKHKSISELLRRSSNQGKYRWVPIRGRGYISELEVGLVL